jgi:hypothetical protein
MRPSRLSLLIILVILAASSETANGQNRQDLSRLQSAVGQIVVLKIPEPIVTFEKYGTWSRRPNFAVTIAPDSVGGLIVGGRANWKEAGMPPMGELVVAKVSRQKRLIEVELRNLMVNVKLRFTPDVPDLFAAFNEVAFFGRLDDFKASPYFRELAGKAAPRTSGIPSGSSARSIPTEVENMDARVQQVISQAESRFKEGELHLKAGERLQAREKFDKAVDIILESGLDIRANQKLQAYYLELVERVFRLETPLQPVPPRIDLAQSGNAQVDYSGQFQQSGQEEPEVGFKQQKFEPSPLDEYARLVLKPESYNSPFGGRCILGLNEAPELRGLRLGMDVAGVRKALANVTTLTPDVRPKDEFGASSVIFRGVKGPNLKGVSKLALKFLDDRLVSISVTYDGSVKWDNAAQFLSRINTALGFPDAWRFVGARDTGDYKMECRGLNLGVEFNTGLSPTLTFNDSEAPRIIVKRREEKEQMRRRAEAEREEKRRRAEEERRKDFKP